MIFKDLFKKPNNQLEGGVHNLGFVKTTTCSHCKNQVAINRVRQNYYICPECGHYFTIGARRRVLLLTDRRSFFEHDRDMTSDNFLDFPQYDEKLSMAEEKSREKEAVICGNATIGGYPVCIFVMESRFMMGSMGSIVGEKITRLFEYATKHELPVIGVTVSGGARMQEGMISLMQMSKVSAAVKRHSDAGNLYVVLLTNPTTGGVDASFAMQGDITLAEPGARIGFAGPRVIEQTLRQKLPDGFQRAAEVLKHGFVDAIVPRNEQKDYLIRILQVHSVSAAEMAMTTTQSLSDSSAAASVSSKTPEMEGKHEGI